MSDISETTPPAPEGAEGAAGDAETAAPAGVDAPATAAPVAAEASKPSTGKRINRRKVREGLVSSASMHKTVVVAVVERVRHPRYAKTVQRTRKVYAHVEANDVKVGDRVRVQETRPMSKLKRWRVVEILERAR